MPVSQAKLEQHAPVFPVTDICRALDYYSGPLGFEVAFFWEDEEGDGVRYAILRRDNCELHLTLASRPHKTVAYFFVDSVQSLYREMKRGKANTSSELQDWPWDMREFEVTDTDGNVLIFGEHLSRIS